MFPICLAKYKEILAGSRLFHITVYATKKTKKKQACITVISEYTLNRNILFPDGLFFPLVCKKNKEREWEKRNRAMKTVHPFPQSRVLQSPAFSTCNFCFGQVYVAFDMTFDPYGEPSVWGKGWLT